MFFLPNLNLCLLDWLLASPPCRSCSHTASFLNLQSGFLPFPFPPPLLSHCCQTPFSNLLLSLSPPLPLPCSIFLCRSQDSCLYHLAARVSTSKTLSSLCWPVPSHTEPPRERKPTGCHLAGSRAQVIQKCCAKFKHLQQGWHFCRLLTLEP